MIIHCREHMIGLEKNTWNIYYSCETWSSKSTEKHIEIELVYYFYLHCKGTCISFTLVHFCYNGGYFKNFKEFQEVFLHFVYSTSRWFMAKAPACIQMFLLSILYLKREVVILYVALMPLIWVVNDNILWFSIENYVALNALFYYCPCIQTESSVLGKVMSL